MEYSDHLNDKSYNEQLHSKEEKQYSSNTHNSIHINKYEKRSNSLPNSKDSISESADLLFNILDPRKNGEIDKSSILNVTKMHKQMNSKIIKKFLSVLSVHTNSKNGKVQYDEFKKLFCDYAKKLNSNERGELLNMKREMHIYPKFLHYNRRLLLNESTHNSRKNSHCQNSCSNNDINKK